MEMLIATDLKNKYKMTISLYNEAKGVEVNQKSDIYKFNPLQTGAIIIDRIDEDGMLESNIYPAGTWKHIKIVGDPPPPASHNRRKEDEEKKTKGIAQKNYEPCKNFTDI